MIKLRGNSSKTRKNPSRIRKKTAISDKMEPSLHESDTEIENITGFFDGSIELDEMDAELDQFIQANNEKYFNPTKIRRQAELKDLSDSDNDDADQLDKGISLDEIKKWMRICDKKLPSAIKAYVDKYEKAFPTWMAYLCADFNLLLYGYGSKHSLMDTFRRLYLADYNHLVVEGFRPTVEWRTIADCLVDHLQVEIPAVPAVEMAVRIAHQIERSQTDVILVIHNIDGPGLRDRTSQSALSELAECKFVHLIASIDHVNASLMWDHKLLSRFSWLWLNTPTLLGYSSELLNSDSRLLGLFSNNSTSCAHHSFGSLDGVFRGLTDKARRIVAVLSNMAGQQREGSVLFWKLFNSCRNEFLVTDETVLNRQLVEFKDHRLIGSKIDKNGQQLLVLTVDKALLARILEKYQLS